MKKGVWTLLCVAIVAWGICAAFPASAIHFGWIGTLFGSAAGLIATLSSYQTEEIAHTRGGAIYKSESPIKFALAHALVGLLFVALAWLSVLGSLGALGA
ncbi:putative membrane protein [Ralstonia insidiosa]|uniref:Membrane protein n=1 Tax=Ralstonia insidiosa TaxID=190721 RepID=A0AAC9BKB0_9RALS|nr:MULTISPECIES: hypothetical protein [Ralstonia]ANH75446.1 putative membrane protein [Ralstonia insidiosa]EPX98844.1 hypothetical protein C404_06550 [Ralstonia sp. AU12-08]